MNIVKYIIGIITIFLFPFAWDVLNPNLRYISLGLFSLGMVIWLFAFARSKQPFFIPKIFLPLVIYFFLQIFLLKVTPLPVYSFYWLYTQLITGLFILFVIQTVKNGWKREIWENSLIFVGLLLSYLELIRVLLWFSKWLEISGEFLSSPPIGFRLSGLFLDNPNLLGGFLLLVIPMTFIRLLEKKRNIQRLSWLANLLLLLLTIFFTSSRGAWMGLGVGFFVILLLWSLPHIEKTFKTSQFSLPGSLIIKSKLLSLTIIIIGLSFVPILIQQATVGGHGSTSQRIGIWFYILDSIAESPIWGRGPASVPFIFSAWREALGGSGIFHTHNLILQVGAESGLLGLFLLLWMAWLLIRAYKSSWKNTQADTPERNSLIAYAGTAIAILVHNLVDFLFWKFIISVGVWLFFALLYQHASGEEFFRLNKRRTIPVLFSVAVICVVWFLFSMRGASQYSKGIIAAQEQDWKSTSSYVCQAAALNPRISFYNFQCALTKSLLAKQTDDMALINSSIEYQKIGLGQDPFWHLHWANLASFEWQAGNHAEALEHMRYAVELAPRVALLNLNLGWMEEQSGNLDQAVKYFNLAVCLNPYYRDGIFFQKTSLRRDAVRKKCPSEYDSLRNQFLKLERKGLEAYSINDLSGAEHYLNLAIEENPYNPLPYAYLALIYSRKGRSEEALYQLNLSFFVDETSNLPSSPKMLLVNAEVAKNLGLYDQATDYAKRAYNQLNTSSSSMSYYLLAYRQSPLRIDVSPYLVDVALSTDIREGLLSYVEQLRENGEIEESQEVIHWVEISSSK